MTKTGLAALTVLATVLAGCATPRWRASQSDPRMLPGACATLRAPRVAAFPAGALRGTYQFVTRGASINEKLFFLGDANVSRFALARLTASLDDTEVLIARGTTKLRSQAQVDAEFATACALSKGAIYLSHVSHAQPDSNAAATPVR